MSAPELMKSWREAQQPKLKQSEAARRVPCSQACWSDLEKGRQQPSADMAIKIERATDGAVPVHAWEKAAEESGSGPVVADDAEPAPAPRASLTGS